jgi:hypothetical protein
MLYQLSYASACVATSGGEERSGYSSRIKLLSHTITMKIIAQFVALRHPRNKRSTNELNIRFHRNNAALEAHIQQLANRIPAIFSIV